MLPPEHGSVVWRAAAAAGGGGGAGPGRRQAPGRPSFSSCSWGPDLKQRLVGFFCSAVLS
jgi:hypothetical protein